jgi:hypothetical protein
MVRRCMVYGHVPLETRIEYRQLKRLTQDYIELYSFNLWKFILGFFGGPKRSFMLDGITGVFYVK